MAKNLINALILGDVYGQPGCRALFLQLGQLKKRYDADITVVNGENAANGLGLNYSQMNGFFKCGVSVITSGNHIWQQEDLRKPLDTEPRLLRPLNYPQGVHGHGSVVISTRKGDVGVMNLQGRTDLPMTDDPFRTGLEEAKRIRRKTPVIICDFHAESTAEKESLGFYLDGSISVLVGTHTHVQTADEKILPKGTGYITDLGFCGPDESVIGSIPAGSIEKQITQMPLRNVIKDGSATLHGVFCTIDPKSGRCVSIERIS